MLTKLKIKSSFPEIEVEFNESLRRLTDELTQRQSMVEYNKNDQYDLMCPVFVVPYDNHADLKLAINAFNEHRHVPLEEYEDISANDFTISLEKY